MGGGIIGKIHLGHVLFASRSNNVSGTTVWTPPDIIELLMPYRSAFREVRAKGPGNTRLTDQDLWRQSFCRPGS